MISFRFHVVSITAVFLAIAIGVVVGTTYVDGAVVDGLRNRIDTVESNLDERRDENAALESQLEVARGYIDASMDFAVTDRLTEVPVLVVAARGVEEAAVERTVALTRRAGGVVPGVAWLESGWSLEDEDARRALAEIVDGDPGDAPEDLWADAWSAVAEELAAVPTEGPVGPPFDDPTTPEDEGSEVTPEPDPAPDVLAPLAAAGFLTVDALGDSPANLADLLGGEARVLVVTGSRAQSELVPLVSTVVAEMVGGDVLTVVADVHIDAPEAAGRGQALRDRLSESVRERIVMVDHADRPEGQVAAVLAVAATADAQLLGTHYGYGDGSAGVLPSWTPP